MITTTTNLFATYVRTLARHLHTLMVLGLLLGLLLSMFTPAAHAESTVPQMAATYQVFLPVVIGGGGATALTADEQTILDAINQARALRAASNGTDCPALRVSPQLEAAARAHSADMVARNFFSHINPDGLSPFDRAIAAGYNGSQVAENIAAGQENAAAAATSWLNSSVHRANILDCSLTETGIGYFHEDNDQGNVLRSDGTVGGPYFDYWTQMFGTP